MRTPLLLSLLLLSACIGRELSEVEPDQWPEQIIDVPLAATNDLDILFVIDDSGSMAEEQASLAANFDRFMNVLASIENGMPNVHIGVVSTDVGAGPYAISGCSGSGDDGALQSTPRSAGCTPPAGAFISDVAASDGTRQINYQGSLVDTFGCIARLGIDGCGFEQPLEAARRALNGSKPENAGFLRQNAFLALIFITDEDDCSTENTQMFDTSQDSLDDPLGPLSSFRCFDFGVVCDPDEPRVPGLKTGCRPREDSPYMYSVREYVDFFQGLKDDPSMVLVAGIIGNPTPVSVADGELAPSCTSASGTAAPAVRLNAFLEAFGPRHTVTTICNEDLSDALALIAEDIGPRLTTWCLKSALADPVQCQVSDVVNYGLDDQYEVQLPRCDTADGTSATNQPCWTVSESPSCSDFPASLQLEVFPAERAVPGRTHLVARCLAK